MMPLKLKLEWYLLPTLLILHEGKFAVHESFYDYSSKNAINVLQKN